MQLDQQLARWVENPVVAKIGMVVLSILIALIAIRALQTVASRSIKDTSARYRVRKFISFFGYVITILLLLSGFSDRLGQVGVFFGVAGAGVAFALQEVIASIAGWIAISFGGFYRPGDRVQVGGIKGDVIDIGMLRTTLMEVGDWVKGDLYNGRIVRVANSFVFKEPVYNYSGEFPFLWDEFTIPIRFGSDWQLCQKLIEETIAEHVTKFTADTSGKWKQLVAKFLIEEARVAPLVTLTITDNWIEFTGRYVVDFRQRRIIKDAIMRSLLIAFDVHKSKVGLGSTTIELVGVPPLFVQTTEFGDRA